MKNVYFLCIFKYNNNKMSLSQLHSNFSQPKCPLRTTRKSGKIVFKICLKVLPNYQDSKTLWRKNKTWHELSQILTTLFTCGMCHFIVQLQSWEVKKNLTSFTGPSGQKLAFRAWQGGEALIKTPSLWLGPWRHYPGNKEAIH